MAPHITAESTENTEYVRRLLWWKEPEFAAALELAAELVDWELSSSGLPGASYAPAANDQ